MCYVNKFVARVLVATGTEEWLIAVEGLLRDACTSD
jgi:hypothetical protein